MKSPIAWVALTLALTLSSAAMTAAPQKPTAKAASTRAGWLATIHRTAEGAIVVGNPAAKVKMVEYLSLTCSHCADLSASALDPLRRDYIARGLVSLEVRHAVRDGYDFAASLLLRCAAPTQYLGSIEALFATQPEWMGKGAKAKDVQGFDAMSPDQKMVAAARAAGFDSFFAARGMSPAAFSACMADAKAKDQLTQMAGNSWQRDKIPGTPFILINGKRQESVHDWAELEPLIKAALR